MVAEPWYVPNVTVGKWKSGSKQKKDWPNFQLYCHNSFHLLESSKKSVEKLEIQLWRLFLLPNGDWVCPWAWLASTLLWFRGKNIDALTHMLALIFSNTRPYRQHSTFFCLSQGTRHLPGLLCHGGCWQISRGESHAWLVSLPISWKFSPSPLQGKCSSCREVLGSSAHPLTIREQKGAKVFPLGEPKDFFFFFFFTVGFVWKGYVERNSWQEVLWKCLCRHTRCSCGNRTFALVWTFVLGCENSCHRALDPSW